MPTSDLFELDTRSAVNFLSLLRNLGKKQPLLADSRKSKSFSLSSRNTNDKSPFISIAVQNAAKAVRGIIDQPPGLNCHFNPVKHRAAILARRSPRLLFQ